MKTKTQATLAAIAALLITATACTNDHKSNELAFEVHSASAAYTLHGSAADFRQSRDVIYCDSVSLLLPTVLEGNNVNELRDSIIARALGTNAPSTVSEAMTKWLDDMAANQGYKAEKLTTDSLAADAQGFDNVNGFIVNMTPDILVYCLLSESYNAGAAHGLVSRSYINYDLRDGGSVITLQKLFTQNGLALLPARISEQAEALSDIVGPTNITELPANGNFYISSEGEIVFSYQPYEVASFAQGTIDIPFYPYELASYFTPFAVAMFGLEDLE